MPRVYDKDPYAILGVPNSASASQIKQAYRRLARQYHPDLNKDPRAAERMKDINWANGILSDPAERSNYDYWRATLYQASAQPQSTPPRSTPPPYASSSTTSRNPPPRYANIREMQNTRAQSCSSVSFVWIAFILIMNLVRSAQSKPQPDMLPYFDFATQTARSQEVDSAIETFIVQQNLHARTATFASESLLQTAIAPSATPEVDEFGRENLRARVVPGSKEWEWLNTYFPEYNLTTPDGVSDEVTFVYWDQVQRAIIVETRQSGTFFFFVGFTGQLTVGHTDPESPTSTAVSPVLTP